MIGLNILSQYVSDRAALTNWLIEAAPQAVVIMDDAAFARGVKALLPASIIIHRTYHPNDKKWHTTHSPADWLKAYQPTGANGVVVQAFNEPEIGDLGNFLDWLEGLVRLCPPDLTLCLPNFAVGNPNERLIESGAFDRLLRLVCGSRHWLGLHEYFKADPLGEAPYLCGRFAFWHERADALDLPRPKIVLTEHGRDIGGQRGDGWRGTGWAEDRYADLLTEAHRRLYLPHNIPVCVFGYGRGADDEWQSFSVEGADTVLRRIAEYNLMTTQPPTDPRTAITTIALRLRPKNGTDQAALTTIPLGAEITVWLSPVLPDTDPESTLEWVNAQWGESKGWIAVKVNGAATYEIQEPEPPPVDPDPPPIFSVWLTIDEMEQDLALELEAAQLHKAQGQIVAQQEVNARKRAALLQKAIDRAR